MGIESVQERIILTNMPNYFVTDENCENIYYKAMADGLKRVLIGPSSSSVGEMFGDRGVMTGVAIAYPSGTVCPELKAAEIIDCEQSGGVADMYFVTAAVGYFMSGHEDNLKAEIRQCVSAVHKPVYVIVEAAEMADSHLEKLCQTAREERAAGIVASTAFMPYDIKRPGAEDIRRIKKYSGDELEVIAAGEIQSLADVEKMIEAGADAVILNESSKIVEA